MEKQRQAKRARRREFLKLAGIGALAGAAAGAVAPDRAEAAPSAASKDAGYRETEHVRKAYALSRF